MPAELGSSHQPALSAMGMVAGSTGMAKRLAQDPAEALTQTTLVRNSFSKGPQTEGLLFCHVLCCGLAWHFRKVIREKELYSLSLCLLWQSTAPEVAAQRRDLPSFVVF